MQAVLDESAELLQGRGRHAHLRDPSRLRVRQRGGRPVERLGRGRRAGAAAGGSGPLRGAPAIRHRRRARRAAGGGDRGLLRPRLEARADGRGDRRGRPRSARPVDRAARTRSAAICASRPSPSRTPSRPRPTSPAAKDSLEPVVLVRGLDRYVTREDGPGAAALRRPAERGPVPLEPQLRAARRDHHPPPAHQHAEQPQRGRTCQWVQPGSPMSSLETCTQRWLAGSSSISSIKRRLCSSARPRSSSAARPRRTCSTRSSRSSSSSPRRQQPRSARVAPAGDQVEALARPGRAEEADRLLLQPPHLVEQRAARGTLVRTRTRSDRRDALRERASRQLEPSDSIPRRSACPPSPPGAPSPCSSTIDFAVAVPTPTGPPPACIRSSSPPARSPSPSPCP